MSIPKQYIYTTLFLFYFSSLYSINYSILDTIKYTTEYKFIDGIYLNFDQVLKQNPIPFKNIVSSQNNLSTSFIEEALTEEEVTLFIDGEKSKLKTNSLWGYSMNGVLFFQIYGQFYRVPSIGTISFFVASVEVEYQTNADPWNNSYYNHYERTYKTTELQMFLIDFTNGTLYQYSIENVVHLISSDMNLHQEFVSLKKRKQKQLAFMYIRRFNELHPLYFTK